MPRKTQKAKLVLSKEQQEELKKTVQSRKAPIREVQRANILLGLLPNEWVKMDLGFLKTPILQRI